MRTITLELTREEAEHLRTALCDARYYANRAIAHGHAEADYEGDPEALGEYKRMPGRWSRLDARIQEALDNPEAPCS